MENSDFAGNQVATGYLRNLKSQPFKLTKLTPDCNNLSGTNRRLKIENDKGAKAESFLSEELFALTPAIFKVALATEIT
jgi:hypothetical protein